MSNMVLRDASASKNEYFTVSARIFTRTTLVILQKMCLYPTCIFANLRSYKEFVTLRIPNLGVFRFFGSQSPLLYIPPVLDGGRGNFGVSLERVWISSRFPANLATYDCREENLIKKERGCFWMTTNRPCSSPPPS